MLGAIAGDVVGSPYERANYRSTDFPLFSPFARFTDDTVLTVATAHALLDGSPDYGAYFRRYFEDYPRAGFGGLFRRWAWGELREPYASFGNGSAMRVSPVAWAFETLEEVLAEAASTAQPTHSHPEGVRGAQTIAGAAFLARTGAGKGEVRGFVEEQMGYRLGGDAIELGRQYGFATCQASVGPAVDAFLEGESFENCLRLAVAKGGDSDTIACMAGAIAEGFYGIPGPIEADVLGRLDESLLGVVRRFRSAFSARL